MTDYVVRDTQLTSVADAIRAKGGTSDPLAFPDGFVSAVEAIPTGGGPVSVPAKEVNFRDYDGTVVYSYTPAEFAALTAMPANPDHSGDEIPLTSQGWNWSFADAQTYVAKYGRLEVGQMYATADGKTHVLIHLEQGRTSPILGCCPNGTVDVDWGDGTAHDTLTGTSVTTVKWTPRHEYAAPGDYDIKLTCTGTMGFYGSSTSNQNSGLLRYSSGADIRNRLYQNAIQAVYFSEVINSIGNYALRYCTSLSSISIPNSVTSIFTDAFRYCYNLTSVSIPDSVTSISNNAFSNTERLSSVSIPNGVTSITKGAFSGCHNLTSVSIPDSVMAVAETLFSGCARLTSVNISDSATSIQTGAFSSCYTLTSISIPDSVTSIGTSAFSDCGGVAELHFLPATPPTVASASAFSSIPTDCKIYVPTGSLSAYTTATNYPSSSTYTYIEE